MKPRIFIGSSVEGLDVANTIQENLNYDAVVTVWSQGVFKLSSNSLDDLISSMETFDFGIFVFKPDDLTQIRDSTFRVVRDNVILELGLFIGKLGKDKVFFVLPEGIDNFHLPTDLLGVLAGKYDAIRADGNLQAALSPFCNQVRLRIKEFVFESLNDLNNESKDIKKIAVEKKGFWEAFLLASLLRSRMVTINKSAYEIRSDYIFKELVHYNLKDGLKWFIDANRNLVRMVEIAANLYNKEIYKSFGEPGNPGNVIEIKGLADKIAQLCKECISWELNIQSIRVPKEFKEIQTLMQRWPDSLIDAFNELPNILEREFSEENIEKHELSGTPINVELTFLPPKNADRINEIIAQLEQQILNGNLNI